MSLGDPTAEQRYRSLVENLPGSVVILFDRDLRFVLVDGPEVTATGFSKEAMEGKTLHEAIPEPFASAVEPNMLRVLAGERFSAEIPFDDRFYHYEYVPIRAGDGEVQFGLIVGQNVTERVRTEQDLERRERQFRTLAENLPDIVARVDRELRFVYLNPMVERVGGTPQALMGKTFGELLGAQRAKEWREVAREVLTSGSSRSLEDEVQGPSGPRLWAARLVPERGMDGAIESVLVLSRDVTDERRAERERMELEARVRQVGKLDALGRLAGGVAHDFNNLLSAIHGYASLLLREAPAGSETYTDLLEIQRAAQRGTNLTSQLLAFSRKHVTEPVLLDLDEVVRNALRMVTRLLGEDVEVSFEPQEALPMVRVDAGQLDQVIVNLAVNARDAMPNGGHLEIVTRERTLGDAFCARRLDARPGRYVQLSVRDSGRGMSQELLEHVFEPFFTTKAVGQGTGLGLSIVYGIIRGAGGFVDVTSQPDSGSTFDVFLPAHDRVEAGPPRSHRESEPTGPLTILLVEDEPAVLEVTARLLRIHGYTVHTAAHPEHALTLASDPALHVDVLLTDVIMPALNGRQLYEKLKQERPGLVVVFLSGYTDDVIAGHLAESAVHFVQKPFTPSALLAKIGEAVATARGD